VDLCNPSAEVPLKYLIAAALNQKPLDRSWLRHAEIAAGRRLVLIMGNTPRYWAETNLPPSASVHR